MLKPFQIVLTRFKQSVFNSVASVRPLTENETIREEIVFFYKLLSMSVLGTDYPQSQRNDLQQSSLKSLCLGGGRGNRNGEAS